MPEAVTESLLRQRYGLTASQLNAVLDRIGAEGWIERRPGYGWEFSAMMRTPDALLQSYRLRLALEPAALLEPGYRLDPAVLARCRQAEMHLLDGGIETDSADQLHDRGVRFHESLVEASGNAFFIDAIRRVNRVRRLRHTARCATASATANTASSTCASSTCWNANATRKPRTPCASTCRARCATSP